MNSTGFIRGYMAKNMENERFLEHVVWVLERQLQEWDESYQLRVFKQEDFIISVQSNKKTINVSISANRLKDLQSASPYSLDRYIWAQLKEKGLEWKDKNGNYLDYVFP